MVGEEIEYVPMDSQTVYQAMADGDIDIVHEVWEGAFGASFTKSLETGNVIDLLTHDAVTREDWWYPEYIEEVCPGFARLEGAEQLFGDVRPRRFWWQRRVHRWSS